MCKVFAAAQAIPLISVIIPVYNTERYLRRCIQSVVEGTYHNLEVICVNDGSSDGSLDILNELSSQDNRIRIINKENGGVSSARNAGLKACNGEYVSFVDSDDWVHPRYFEILVDAMCANDAHVVACDIRRIKDECQPWPEINTVGPCQKLSLTEVLNGQHLKRCIWARIYKRDILSEVEFDESIHYAEDVVYNLSVLCGCDELSFVYVPEILYSYFNREDSAVNTLEHASAIETVYKVYFPTYESFGINKHIILEQACRAILASRYMLFFYPNEEYKKKCDELIPTALSHFHDLSLAKRVMYYVFLKFPKSYRLYRVMREPYYLKWEKVVKEQRRNAESNNRES